MGARPARQGLHRIPRAAALNATATKRFGHVARRRFGQHFLTDGAVVDAIVDAVDPRPGEALVEIGPGLGALTWSLLARCGRLTVIELDRDLAQRLRQRPGLEVIEADVLDVDVGTLAAAAGRRLRIAGNLPYNVSSPILFHLLASADRVVDQHFMLQKEVVERMVAAPCSKAYGRLSVMLQWRYAMASVLDVPPGSFEPPPRVDSAVVRMQPLPDSARLDAGLLSELVRVAFSQRRKLLRHTLGRWLEANDGGAGFDVQRRAEEVPVAEYVALAGSVSAARSAP